MIRGFEKISKKQFDVDFKDYDTKYEDIKLPKRSTIYSVGYDFFSPIDFTLKSNQVMKLPTGLKVYMLKDEFLMIVVRSGIGFKYNVRETNQVGIIDTDYYNNINNEGHMFISLQNHGDKDFVVRKGDRIVQGIFQKYLLADDDDANNNRVEGLGSTGR